MKLILGWLQSKVVGMGYSTLKWIEEEEEIKNSPDFWRAITQVEKDGNPLLHCHSSMSRRGCNPLISVSLVGLVQNNNV